MRVWFKLDSASGELTHEAYTIRSRSGYSVFWNHADGGAMIEVGFPTLRQAHDWLCHAGYQKYTLPAPVAIGSR